MDNIQQEKIYWERFWEIYYSFLGLARDMPPDKYGSHRYGLQADSAKELRIMYNLLFHHDKYL